MSVTQMIQEIKSDRKYTPPITLEYLGWQLFEAGQQEASWWPVRVVRGYRSAMRAAAWADGAAYLVSQGEQVSI